MRIGLLASLLALASLTLGPVPAQAAPFAYVSNSFDDTVSVIDTATNQVVTTVPVGHLPLGVAVHPAGTFVYVANGFGDGGRSLFVISTAEHTVGATVHIGDREFPQGVAVHPDGTFVYVTSADPIYDGGTGGNLTVIDAQTLEVVS